MGKKDQNGKGQGANSLDRSRLIVEKIELQAPPLTQRNQYRGAGRRGGGAGGDNDVDYGESYRRLVESLEAEMMSSCYSMNGCNSGLDGQSVMSNSNPLAALQISELGASLGIEVRKTKK